MAELILQLQEPGGRFSCERFTGFPAEQSAYVSICFTDTTKSVQMAITLRQNLIDQLTALSVDFKPETPPCHGVGVTFQRCQALAVTANRKLLIVVSDGSGAALAVPDILAWPYQILPVFQQGHFSYLPVPFDIPNAIFWTHDISTIIPTLFGLLGISAIEQRIFISYRRTETSLLAEQLFDRLGHEGFDVFLDRFSIAPALNFQNRLYQELSDKALVLLLESRDYQNSKWVMEEVNFARRYRLGLMAVNVDGAPKVLAVHDSLRTSVVRDTQGKMDEASMDQLINTIKSNHATALYRMRNNLMVNLQKGLRDRGAKPIVNEYGFIEVIAPAGHRQFRVLTTPRPPMVNDFHRLDITNSTSHEMMMFGPEFLEASREAINNWLTQKTFIKYYNEGQLLDICREIHP